MQNLHQLFDWQYIGQIIGGDFAKFCGLLIIYELYMTYDSPLSAFGGEVIPEVASFIEEGLVISEG